jgi:thiol-disulfide isomerase/thioredoxin
VGGGPLVKLKIFLVVLTVSFCLPALSAQSLDGRWSATINVDGAIVPFRMDFVGNGPEISGSFFNGKEKIASSSGQFKDGSLVLNFDAYAAQLKAVLKDDCLEGQYVRAAHPTVPFEAKRYIADKVNTSNVPRISGNWEIQTHTRLGESALLLVVRQSGAHVDAAISRVDGDTGNIDGIYKDGKFVLGHFDGARPLLLEIVPAADGSLHIVQNGNTKLVALRPSAARAKGLVPPVDPAQHTHVQNPAEPLHFSFPDLTGKIITNRDPRFRGKVVLVTIMGSWCPNCHDEAPLLESLYRKYRSRGLEIVALSFEEADQLKNPVEVKAFIKQYGIDYTVLLAGEPDELAAKIPQAVNLNAFPTTFFLDRSGRVQSVHAGFAGVATGDLYTQLVQETTEKIEHLLAETTNSENRVDDTKKHPGIAELSGTP